MAERCRHHRWEPSSSPAGVTSGRLEKYKGHHRVIETLPYVIQDVPEAHVVILGSGPYQPELRALAGKLGVSDRVSITHVPPADRTAMAIALAEAHVVAALSDYEAHPVAVMEALSVGRPVAGYDTSGIGDLVTEGWVRGIRPGSSAATVAQVLVDVMSSGSLVAPAQLPSWDDSRRNSRACTLPRRAPPLSPPARNLRARRPPAAQLQNPESGL